jgi:DNA-binding NtrC family response regulator
MNVQNVDRQAPRGLEENKGMAPLSDLELSGAAQTDACLLVTGRRDAAQSVAYRIHCMSGWRHGPFIVMDCGWPDAALEERLFAVWPGTNAKDPEGLPHARLAQAGTVLLQEVGRLSPSFQVRLADRLEDLRGCAGYGRSRLRLMASSSESLERRVIEGTFDDRLFYRLNVIHVMV